MCKLAKFIVQILFGLFFSITAKANIITLDFEKIANSYPFDSSNVFVNDYYNGGTSSVGTSGPNYGIGFSSNSLVICLNSNSVFCSNTSRGGLAPSSAQGGLFFLSGVRSIMNIAAGFDTGFSFNYVSYSQLGNVRVWDDLNASGNLLTSLSLVPNAGSCQGYSAGFCPFSPIGVSFSGIAKSVSFEGVANQIAFDDITFGSVTPGDNNISVPEPNLIVLMSLGLVSLFASSRRKLRISLLS